MSEDKENQNDVTNEGDMDRNECDSCSCDPMDSVVFEITELMEDMEPFVDSVDWELCSPHVVPLEVWNTLATADDWYYEEGYAEQFEKQVRSVSVEVARLVLIGLSAGGHRLLDVGSGSFGEWLEYRVVKQHERVRNEIDLEAHRRGLCEEWYEYLGELGSLGVLFDDVPHRYTGEGWVVEYPEGVTDSMKQVAEAYFEWYPTGLVDKAWLADPWRVDRFGEWLDAVSLEERLAAVNEGGHKWGDLALGLGYEQTANHKHTDNCVSDSS